MARLGLIARALRRAAQEAPEVVRGTPAASAAEYSTTAYRGFPAGGRRAEGQALGDMTWWTDDPVVAESYARQGAVQGRDLVDEPVMQRGQLRLGRALEIDAGGAMYHSIPGDALPPGLLDATRRAYRRELARRAQGQVDNLGLVDRARVALTGGRDRHADKWAQEYWDEATINNSQPNQAGSHTRDIARAAQDLGYDSVVFRNVRDFGTEPERMGVALDADGRIPMSTVYAILARHNQRLPHARFQDLSSSDLLAATTAGAPIGLLALLRAREEGEV